MKLLSPAFLLTVGAASTPTTATNGNKQQLMVTPSPTPISAIDPKLLLVQPPKESDANGDSQPASATPVLTVLADSEATSLSTEDQQTPSKNDDTQVTTAAAIPSSQSINPQTQPVFYLTPLIMPLLPNSQGSSATTSTMATPTSSLATLAQLGQQLVASSSAPSPSTSNSSSAQPQLIPIQSLLADAQTKVKLEQLITPEALKLLDQSADGFKCTWKLDVKQSPVLTSALSPTQVSPDSNMLLANTQGEDKKAKRKRQVFSGLQTEELEQAFQVSPYVSAVERERLAVKVGLSPDQVKVWFQNRRTKKYRSSWRKAKQGGNQVAMESSSGETS